MKSTGDDRIFLLHKIWRRIWREDNDRTALAVCCLSSLPLWPILSATCDTVAMMDYASLSKRIRAYECPLSSPGSQSGCCTSEPRAVCSVWFFSPATRSLQTVGDGNVHFLCGRPCYVLTKTHDKGLL